jgi:hypothetical protein
VPGRGLRRVEDPGEIHGNHSVPLFRSDVEKAVTDADSGVIHQNIDAAHPANRFGIGSLHLLQVRNIGIEQGRQTGQFLLDFPPRLGVTVEHAHHGSLFKKSGCRGCSDATGSAGDQDSLRFQAAHSRLRKRKSGRSGYLSARERAIGAEVGKHATCIFAVGKKQVLRSAQDDNFYLILMTVFI